MRFENPLAFYFLWAIPVLWVLAVIFHKRAQKKMAEVIGSRLYPFLSSSVSIQKRNAKRVLQSLVILFFVLALARPQMGQSMQEIKSEGVEIMLVIDVSESMMSEDVRPNRLEQAKTDLSRLLDRMPGNRVGVIAFAGTAAVLSPLSNDPNAVKMYLESLSPNSVSSQGTNFEDALKVAAESFKRGGVADDDTAKVTRVILVASDGEDHEPGAMEAAKKLAEQGIKIFSLAYGTEKGGPIPIKDGMGFWKSNKKDRNGQTVITAVKGDALRALAQAGEGSFYFATFGSEYIRSVADDLAKLEKSEFESKMAVQYEERFQLFLLIGILLGLVELFLGERRSSFKLWKGRYEVPPV
ncbi:vWA domain-containing protein [Bdellovibrio sp. HCB337]|uniref:vWA domain-containing protein n=1 Tax=Bdellovibrio sp. HCB337 TaxID=3394358 RepID=UPI0039A541AD